jgi:hypothetical protein
MVWAERVGVEEGFGRHDGVRCAKGRTGAV